MRINSIAQGKNIKRMVVLITILLLCCLLPTAAWAANITFDRNTGTGTVPATITGVDINTEVELPSPDNLTAPANTIFIGWSTNKNAIGYGVDNYKSIIMPAGTAYTVTGNQTLYAIWAPTNVPARFYIYDGTTVPHEPRVGSVGEYHPVEPTGIWIFQTAKLYDDVIKKGYFLFDDNPDLESNEVHLNLNWVPSPAQVRTAVSTYNEETQKVMWYVMKYDQDGSWHIDGLILNDDQFVLRYNSGCNVESGF